VTALLGGVLSVSSLADAGSPSNIGQYPTTGPGGLVLGGGTLEYTGPTATTDRGFTLGGNITVDVTTPGAALTFGDCAGSGNLTVTGGAGSSLTLGAVTFGGAVTVDSGKLMLPGVNTYGGATTVNGGTVVITGSCNNSSVTVKGDATIAGGGSVKHLSLDANAVYTWSYGDYGDHVMNVTNNLTLTDKWVLKLADLGDDPEGAEEYDLLLFEGNYNGAAVNDVIELTLDANFTLDLADAPDWNVDNLEVYVDTHDAGGFRVFATGISGATPGDTNGDGVVDAADYLAVKRSLGLDSGASLEQGDVDGDGDVDWSDLSLMAGALNNAAGATIPEPGSAFLLLTGAGWLLRRRRAKA